MAKDPPTANEAREIDKNANENKKAADAAKEALKDLQKLGAMAEKLKKELKDEPE